MMTIDEIEARMKSCWEKGDHIGWSSLWWVRRDLLRDRRAIRRARDC
jgi:hypothetical protein